MTSAAQTVLLLLVAVPLLAGIAWKCQRAAHFHLVQFSRPLLQSLYVRILWLPAVYAAMQVLTILAPGADWVFDALAACYEAYVLICYFAVFVLAVGGHARTVEALEADGGKLLKVRGGGCTAYEFGGGHERLRCQRRCVSQWMFFKPLSIVWIGLSGEHQASIGFAIIFGLLSVALLLSVLMRFYLGLRGSVPPDMNVGKKFAVIKLIVFFSVTGRLIKNLIWDEEDHSATQWYSLLVVFEMLLASYLLPLVFPVGDVSVMGPPRPVSASHADIWKLRDVLLMDKWEERGEALMGSSSSSSGPMGAGAMSANV